MLYSPDERKCSVTLENKSVKRRRIFEPFCYLSAKQLNLKRKRKRMHITSTADEQTQTDDEIEEYSYDEESNEVGDEDANVQLDNDSDISLIENAIKESTPMQLSLKGKLLTPSVPELFQAILYNPHFQMKLVDNINQALSHSTNKESQTVLSNINTASTSSSTNAATLSEEQQIINSNEMLDQMVKDILKATEKDPAFDAIIENVVGASLQPNIVSAGVQCNIDSNPLPQALLSASTVPAMVGQQQQHINLVQQQQQHQQEETQFTGQVEKTVAVKKNDMQKLKTRVTESGKSVTYIPKSKPTESECQQMLKTLTADKSKLNNENFGEENIESQEKSTEKDDGRKDNEQQESTRKTERAQL